MSRSVATEPTGHKTEGVCRRYAIADEAALQEGVGKRARLHESEPGTRKTVHLKEARREAKRAPGF